VTKKSIVPFVLFLTFLYVASVIFIALPLISTFSGRFGDFLYRPAQTAVGIFGSTKVSFGKACNQSGDHCIPSFNYEGGFSDFDDYRFLNSIEKLTAAHSEVSTVCFNSPGGRNEVAAQVAEAIKSKGLNTCVADILLKDGETISSSPRYTSSCQSACVFTLLAGKQRISVGDRFVIGLHSSVGPTETSKDRDRKHMVTTVGGLTTSVGISYMSEETAQSVLRDYTGKLAISDDQLLVILSETSRTPASRMYYPSPKVLFDLKILTDSY
jgi:hypothetical protein